MTDKVQNMSDKVIHIKSNSAEPDKQVSVKYLSEIITARVEEIIMAILYEIHKSGFADMLRSGLVITGGGAQIANLGNFIYDLSGYRVRTGYPKALFSCQGCDDINETTACTSLGLILAAKDDVTLNCAINGIPTETETPIETVVTEPTTVEEENTADTDNGLLFNNDVLDDIKEEPTKKAPEPKKCGLKVFWKKINNYCGELYETVNKEIDNEDA
jgi:cell division protein FtsA